MGEEASEESSIDNLRALGQMENIAAGGLASDPVEVGHKFDLPILPIPSTSAMKYRYDPIVIQITNLMMRDGKKSVAQRVSRPIRVGEQFDVSADRASSTEHVLYSKSPSPSPRTGVQSYAATYPRHTSRLTPTSEPSAISRHSHRFCGTALANSITERRRRWRCVSSDPRTSRYPTKEAASIHVDIKCGREEEFPREWPGSIRPEGRRGTD